MLRVMDVFSYLIPAALIAVAAVLALGIYALFRGGDFGRSYSNKLMRLRVVMQAIAVAVLMGAVWWRAKH
ncbi:MAG TPA: twin transmembrane helix small protein [Phenylobacterium sp.]|nr:twin transmembrane helix small protein [Phenylobacterium sp.]